MKRNDHFMCESCGTVGAKKTKKTRLDQMLRKVSGKNRFTCGHCGWTGLRNWSHTPAAIAQLPAASRSRASRASAPHRLEAGIDSNLMQLLLR